MTHRVLNRMTGATIMTGTETQCISASNQWMVNAAPGTYSVQPVKPTYYVVKDGDFYTLRQSRYHYLLALGDPHPHDIMAQCFDAAGMWEIIIKHFRHTDTSVLPPY